MRIILSGNFLKISRSNTQIKLTIYRDHMQVRKQLEYRPTVIVQLENQLPQAICLHDFERPPHKIRHKRLLIPLQKPKWGFLDRKMHSQINSSPLKYNTTQSPPQVWASICSKVSKESIECSLAVYSRTICGLQNSIVVQLQNSKTVLKPPKCIKQTL